MEENERQMESVQLSTEQIVEIIERLQADENAVNREIELLCGYVLLAEAYVKEKKYSYVKELAGESLQLIKNEELPVELILNALKRLVKVLEQTPYNHLLRDLLARLVMEYHNTDAEFEEYKGFAENLIKLDILLEPDPYLDKDSDLEDILSDLFSSSELIGFIRNPLIGYLRHDRVEYTWQWEDIAEEVETQLDELLKDVPRGMGFCFRYWSEKERLLKEKYGIDWHSPAIMNPGVIFD